jgi:acyl-coenzyme A thioesterase PaaI-like protein
MRSNGIVVFTGACGLAPRPRACGPHPGTVLAAAATIAARRNVRLVTITAGRDRLNRMGVATHTALRDAADGVRQLIDRLVTADASAEALHAVTKHVREAVAALAPFPSGPGRRSVPGTATQDPAVLMPFDCVVGPLSPLAPPLVVRWEPPRAVADIAFTAPYEGPPDCVHGGVIAAAFDQIFNVANLMHGTPGPTASLRLRYRRPTPLAATLRFEGWQERVEERRVHVRGRLLAGDQVTVEAEGTFALVPVERILALLAPDDDGSGR